MKKMALEYRLVVEAAGAIAATVLPRISADRPLAIVSGGNVDLSIIADAKSEVVHQGAA